MLQYSSICLINQFGCSELDYHYFIILNCLDESVKGLYLLSITELVTLAYAYGYVSAIRYQFHVCSLNFGFFG